MNPKLTEKIFWNFGWIYDLTKLATGLLIIGLLVHSFLITVLIVRGRSMEPNFLDGQILTVDKLAYRRDLPQRSDVVAMYFPGEIQKRFIKRIVGLPGEHIELHSGQLMINGRSVQEDYLASTTLSSGDIDLVLQQNEYFVLGDNRGNSSDSRAWGPVPKSFLIGRVGTSLYRPSTSN